jgi:hypothetical protein
MALEADAEEIEGLTLVPVRGRPDPDDARDRLPVVEPDLDADPWSALAKREEVVADGEALRLQLRQPLEALGRRRVQVATACRGDVSGDTLRAPAEVVGRTDVREEGEPLLVS